MEAELQNFKSHNILCAKAKLRDLKQSSCVDVELQNVKSQYISCVEAELRDFQALFLVRKRNVRPSIDNILRGEAELKVSVQWRQNLKYRICI